MLCIALAIGTALAEPSLTDADLVAAIREFQQHSHFPVPLPSERRREQLLDGKVIKQRLPSDDDAPVGAMALVISDLSKRELWLGSADDDGGTESPDELIVHHLPVTGSEMFRWYGYVRLPVPVSDRHFLIRTTVNLAMHQRTDGRMWSRYWEIEEGGEQTARALVAQGQVEDVTPDAFVKAVWTPVNRGTWIFIDLPDGRTILGYQATGSMGGGFPDGLVNRYIYWGLGKVIDDVLQRAARARTHYSTRHSPIVGGDGQPLPPFQ